MVIVKLMGGIGNQMFQYAFFYHYKQNGEEVVLKPEYNPEDIILYGVDRFLQVYGLEDLCVSDDELYRFLGNDKKINRLVRRVLKQNNPRMVVEAESGKYDEKYLQQKNVCLEGYWQSEKYFCDYREELLDLYTPKLEMNESCKKMIDEIQSDPGSVAVHVRRGDYLREPYSKIYGNICDVRYYVEAFNYMNKVVEHPTFYIFSDETDNVKNLFPGFDIKVVNCNSSVEGWADIYLMSLCRHNIIANSTFSWWGAYLNRNQDQKVIAPKKFKNNCKMPDICPEGWIRL